MTRYNFLLLQDSFNIAGIQILLFNDYAMVLMLFIFVRFVRFSLLIINTRGQFVKGYSNSEMLEIVWTVIPRFLLFSLRVPSLFLIYYIERSTKYDLTLKVSRHQWYWSYEINEYGREISVDSYIIDINTIEEVRGYRLLEVDNSVVLPYLSKIRVLITSEDVLHS